MTYNHLIDSYIEKAQPFAQPILNHLRELVHQACPNVEEKVKWGMPFFDYKGQFCMMAAFKQHCTFGFMKASLMKDPQLVINAKSEVAMGHLGRITSIKDLPSDKKILSYLKEAMQLNEDGIKTLKVVTKKAPLEIPKDLLQIIKKNKKAFATFEAFSPSHQREYIEWIIDAKTDATKEKRISQMLSLLEEGKSRNWKYQK